MQDLKKTRETSTSVFAAMENINNIVKLCENVFDNKSGTDYGPLDERIKPVYKTKATN
jgi:hypothetical protein